MNLKLVAAVAALSALFSFTPPAGVYEENVEFVFTGPARWELSLPLFDPSLGNLTGVQYGFELDGSWNEIRQNNSPWFVRTVQSYDSFVPASMEGLPGKSKFALDLYPTGLPVQSFEVARPIESILLGPGELSDTGALVDNDQVLSPVITDPEVLTALTGVGSFIVDATTDGYRIVHGGLGTSVDMTGFGYCNLTIYYIYE